MHSISQTYQKVLLFISATCLFVGYNMTWQTQAVLRSPISIISLVCLAIPAYIGLTRVCGAKKTLLIWLALGTLGITIETVGIATGTPYGSFVYNNPLGGLLFGYAPWALILAWPPLIIGAWVLAKQLSPKRWFTIVIGASILVWFDVIMDPGAVALSFWSFVEKGIYYNVPYTNFLGWILSGSLGISLVDFFHREPLKPTILPTLGLFFSTILWTGVALGHQHTLPAFFGIVLSVAIWWTYSTHRDIDK